MYSILQYRALKKMDTKKLFKQISNIKETQQHDPKFHDYHKLVKMKKLLIDTEKKMFNRIKLFHKESQKILKKKQFQLKIFQKLQTIKKNPLFMNRTRVRENIKTSQGRRNFLKESKSHQSFVKSPIQNDAQQNQKKQMIQKLNQLKLQNVKIIKQDHQRNKSTDKLKQSQFSKEKNVNQEKNYKALTQQEDKDKKQRQKIYQTQLAKEQFIKQRQNQFKKQIQTKYQKQREEFLKLQKHLQELHNAQREALINWKKTITNTNNN